MLYTPAISATARASCCAILLQLCGHTFTPVCGFFRRLKPWDVCAGVLIAQEAGAKVTTMDGDAYTVFDRSLLAAAPGMQEVQLRGIQRTNNDAVQ
jgi:fructose-1,6-bisphosphatase/inositol monophosphatase family enzyme